MPEPSKIQGEPPYSPDLTSKTPELKQRFQGRTFSAPFEANKETTRVEKVKEEKLPSQIGTPGQKPLAGRGGFGKDFRELWENQVRRYYCAIGSGENKLDLHQVEALFNSFLKQDEPQKIKEIVDKCGKEDVVRAVNMSAFVQLAAEKENIGLLKYLVDELGCSPNIAFDGVSPLLFAAQKGNLEMVEFLLPRSSPESFRNGKPSKSGIIAYASSAANPNKGMIAMLIDRREEFPIPISGSRSAALHLVTAHREKIESWLQKDLKIPVKKGESSASLLSRVVEVANTRNAWALHSAVEKDDPVLVDLIVAAGAPPDALDQLGRSPIELTNNPRIQMRLREAQDLQNSFRTRQLDHLLKNHKAAIMDPEDQTFSWSNLIATLESTPFAQPELQSLAFSMRRSLALSFVLENPLLSEDEKEAFLQQELRSLKRGEWLLLNDHRSPGHHKINLVEKQDSGQWLCLQGDRYKGGSKARQISDTRFLTPNVERVMSFCLEKKASVPETFLPQERIPGKIQKKWQGAQDNCVTQSDTVAFDYILGEKLGNSKAALYRQLKPLRLHYLSSNLRKQGLPDSQDTILRWLQSPGHARLSELCPLIIPRESTRNASPKELLNELDCFITADDEGILSLWQKGHDAPAKTAPWQEWQSLSQELPRELCDASRTLLIKNIRRYTEESRFLHFSINENNEGRFVCELFTPEVVLHCKIMQTGVAAFQDEKGEYSILANNFSDLWHNLPSLFEKEALAGHCSPNPEIFQKWVNNVLETAYKTAFRKTYPNYQGERPPIGGSWTEQGKFITDHLQGKWERGNTHTATALFGATELSLTESKHYAARLKMITATAVEEISKWTTPVITGKKHAFRKKNRQVDTVALELPDKWMEKLQDLFDTAWTKYQA